MSTKKKGLIKGKDYIGVGCGAMIFNDQGKVFIARRGPKARNEAGKWDFPGGGVEFGERVHDALKREIMEEYGIVIEIVDLLMIVDHILPDEGQHWVSSSWIARHLSGEATNLEPEKCDCIRWVELLELNPEEMTVPGRNNHKKYIEKYGYNSPF